MDFLEPDAFVATQRPPPLERGEIHLWLFPQWSRAQGRIAQSPLVRGLLADYLDRPAASLTIDYDAHGKPSVDAPVQFNASHSGNLLLIGISGDQSLGVDVETDKRPRAVLELADRFFTKKEAAALRALPEPLQQRAFIDLWSCKEAVLKAVGSGIRFGLDRIAFQVGPRGEVGDLEEIGQEAGPPQHWHVLGLRPGTTSSGALAWRGPAQVVRAFTPARA